MPLRMTLRQKLKRLSGNTPCVIDFGDYTKSGRPFELLAELNEEELNMNYKLSLYSIYEDGSREMKIKVTPNES